MPDVSTKSSSCGLHEAMAQAWDCALAGSEVAYISGPITTGARYVEHRRRGPLSDDVMHRIIERNSADLKRTAARLRKQRREVVIEPASLHLPEWSQADYHRLWEQFIERHARVVIFMPGWQYSYGCALEFAHAVVHSIRTEALSGEPIAIDDGLTLLTAARDDLRTHEAGEKLSELAGKLEDVINRLQKLASPAHIGLPHLRKDESLDLLAGRGVNVAQFVSFSPEDGKPRQAYARVAGRGANERFADLHTAIAILLKASADGAINVRSYAPDDPQSREFLYGLTEVKEAEAAVERLSAQGLHTIVNETIDVADGGVSGVLMGNLLEFAPDDTPRCVERPGTVSLPRGLGRDLLSSVYGFPIDFAVSRDSRLEFSVHPRPRGWKATNLIAWELAEQEQIDARVEMVWPNNFSRMIGDKTFGLLVAHHLGLPVPLTTVINRRIAPFSFGQPTGWCERWIRTAPPEQVPGLFTTHRGWIDPFALLAAEDPEGAKIASVLSQAGVYPAYSGALIVGANGEAIVEGRAGTGEGLMRGEMLPDTVPAGILEDVQDLYGRAEAALGPVRFEWVHDGKQAWIVQLHRGATESAPMRLTSGEATYWKEFNVTEGLARLRKLLGSLPPDTGLVLKGRVGLTSHVADVIRKARVPTKMLE